MKITAEYIVSAGAICFFFPSLQKAAQHWPQQLVGSQPSLCPSVTLPTLAKSIKVKKSESKKRQDKKKKKRAEKRQNIRSGRPSAPRRGGEGRLVNLAEWCWYSTEGAFEIFTHSWFTASYAGVVYQQDFHGSRTKQKNNKENAKQRSLISQTCAAQQGVTEMLSAPTRLSLRWVMFLAV